MLIRKLWIFSLSAQKCSALQEFLARSYLNLHLHLKSVKKKKNSIVKEWQNGARYWWS